MRKHLAAFFINTLLGWAWPRVKPHIIRGWDLLLKKLSKKRYAKRVMNDKEIEPPWFTEAIKELGIKEIMGVKHNPRIIEYHSTTDLDARADEVSWCSSFVNWCMKKSGFPGTNSALARSWSNYGEALESPQQGCIVVLSRGKPWQGHVGFYVGEGESGGIKILGGNQSNKVSIKSYNAKRVIAYRWPKMHS